MTLSADRTAIAADGVTVVELVAEASFRGTPVADGKRITFSTTAPVLFDSLQDTEPRVAGGRAEGDTALDVAVRGGRARAYLLAPITEGQLVVEASHTTVNRDVLSDAVTVSVGPPPRVASGVGACGGPGTPVSHFDLRCELVNVGAFVSPRPEIRVPCHLTALDLAGRPLPHTQVELYAEAGFFEDRPATDRAPRTITYVVPPSPSIFPLDVDPMPDEVSQELSVAAQGGVTLNPRDGLVTLLAVVRGAEAFDDANGNGRWDEGECFHDEGEPFLDKNDDGVHDPAVDGPHCCDLNGNGRWDGPNGRYDADTRIGRLTHILWTGPLDTGLYRSGIRTNGDDKILAHGQKTLIARVVDERFNPVAALDDRDEIDFRRGGDPSRQVEFSTPQNPDTPLGPRLGMVLQGAYPRFSFDGLQGVFDRIETCSGALCGRDWIFDIRDDRNPGSSSLANCYTWWVEAEVRYTPVNASGTTRVETLSTSGRLQNEDDDC